MLFRSDGKLIGLDLEIVADCGADAGLGAALPGFTMLLSSGVYDIPRIRVRTRTALTNTTIVSAYRGAEEGAVYGAHIDKGTRRPRATPRSAPARTSEG